MKLFVGNLPFSITEDALHDEFAAQGSVISTKIITDRDTGRSRGFGFVEMASLKDGQAAISGLNGREMDGRQLAVSQAKPQENRGGRDRY
ncbi:MAG TPA: RNA-binding protein [Leptospiraceae bacterium]|jgi:RNA recognition motif-containing protein|nr:RNA-binding protein [Leptospirales bacterium]HMW59373.1 RNA-binding protein [Leptospiraceae bacterium]HMX57703.1 RNA-binding protein [Leptospiraceae bacterium]HMY47924.1 RNA-binding protein [Leptospiraceae bacterium]HNE25360.1 RNA-binding protein [Leptospiraceae bacterium]